MWRYQRLCQSGYSNLGLKGASFYVFSLFSSVSQRIGTQNVKVNKKFQNSFLAGTRRFYCVDADNVPRGFKDYFKWHFETMQTVPYTKRTRRVVMTITHERRLAERIFEMTKAALEGKILPPTHPDSVRMTVIFKNIIDALQREVKKMGCASKHTMLHRIWMGLLRRSQPFTLHLDGLNWEVFAVNDPENYAFCIPGGGKIFVYTGFLKHFRSDVEIATIIGHEVAHIVARHSAEMITKTMQFYVLHDMINLFVNVDVLKRMSPIISKLPFNRRLKILFDICSSPRVFCACQCYLLHLYLMEMEADYIGLLLMASAGYDPQLAPKVYEKFDKFDDIDVSMLKGGYLCSHPTGKQRAEALARPKIMEEALVIYKDVKTRYGVE